MILDYRKQKKNEYENRERIIHSLLDHLYEKLDHMYGLTETEEEISYLELELSKIQDQLYIWRTYD